VGESARLRLKVRHHEVDLYGHVNHANYVHYLEAARVEALEAIGLALPEMRRQGYLLVAVELAVKYHSPAGPGDVLEILTHIREIRGARSIWVQEIREMSSRRLAVTAEVTGAFMTEGGRPVRVPAAFVDKLAALRVVETPSTASGVDPGGPRGTKSRTVSLPRRVESSAPEPRRRAR